jgi:hypothetical protein
MAAAGGLSHRRHGASKKMSTRLLVGIAFFSAAMTGIFLGNMFQLMMIGEVNRKNHDDQQISFFWFDLSKIVRIFKEYRRLYPEGKLHLAALGSIALGGAGMAGLAVCLRILGG